MTLEQKIQLVSELIAENDLATIGEFISCVADIEQIENQTEDMASRKGKPNLPEEKKQQILALAKQKIAANRIAKKCLVSINQVYKVCAKDAGSIQVIQKEGVKVKKAEADAVPTKTISRVKGEYSNAGSIQTTQKYAV